MRIYMHQLSKSIAVPLIGGVGIVLFGLFIGAINVQAATSPVCGSSNGGSFEQQPMTGLCSAGDALTVSRVNNEWQWKCEEHIEVGFSPYTPITVNCHASVQQPRVIISPVCGSSNGKVFEQKPMTGLCSVGSATIVSQVGMEWQWKCVEDTGVVVSPYIPEMVSCRAVVQESQVVPICGNGVKESGEQCDDGNLVSGDMCSATCTIEESKPVIPNPATPAVPQSEPKKKENNKCDGSIGNFIWNDTNKNGVQDDGEAGLKNITVKLIHGNDVDKENTSKYGKYSFDDLCGESYTVVVDSKDLGTCVQTYDPDGKLDNTFKVSFDGKDHSTKKADFGYFCEEAPRQSLPRTGAGNLIFALAGTLATVGTWTGRRYFLKK